MSSSKNCLVVGAGPIGLVSAMLASKKGYSVTLIDLASEVGGLMKSHTVDGYMYDYGTHYLPEIGIPEVDDFFYGPKQERNKKFFIFDYLRTGHFLKRQWNTHTHLMDMRHLENDDYAKGLGQFMTAPGLEDESQSLDKNLRGIYGTTFYEQAFEPLMKKIYGVPAEELSPSCLTLFSLNRIVALDAKTATHLKELPLFERRLGFHSCTEGKPGYDNYYPKDGGLSNWSKMVEKNLQELGVKILTGTTLKEAQLEDEQIKSVLLSNGEKLDTDKILWSIPTPILLAQLKALGGGSKPSRFRNTILAHVAYKPKLPHTMDYAYNYDPDFLSFRLTFYDKTRNQANPQLEHLTIECLTEDYPEESDIQRTLADEMERMDLVASRDNISGLKIIKVPKTFPIYTPDYENQAMGYNEQLKELAKNVIPLGRSAGKEFTFVALCRKAHAELSNFL